MLYNAGLVLEGGGMRGVYTAGVLDFFLDKEIEFASCYGVSAGAAHLCSYISKQRGRALHVNIDYLEDKNYCSPYSLLTTGDLFNVKMCYDTIPNKLLPYDYEEAEQYPGKAYAVVTNIETGEPEYLRLRDMHKDLQAVRASCSLPLVSRNVPINGKLYLDGGISDAVPIQKSILKGNRKNIVVLTKEIGYRRKPSSQLGLIKMRYARYPKIYELMKNRHITYNQMLDYLDAQVENGQAFVIRPKKASGIGRIEKNRDKLVALYETGYEDAQECYEQMMTYLNGNEM
ncbi:MAG: patatin family protein [Lachnospiraceae bacterium]|nr:patatin family protein [Lachnospiraceae bacterium]